MSLNSSNPCTPNTGKLSARGGPVQDLILQGYLAHGTPSPIGGSSILGWDLPAAEANPAGKSCRQILWREEACMGIIRCL